ncbi:MAG: hypothetical protein P4L10_02115 [Acidobacteriaceae bacterium]|nr:hypothetical protein [Acidobacteriaceae bacterium]
MKSSSKECLCSALFGVREDEIWLKGYRLAAAFYIHVLRPLFWLGLLDEYKVGERLRRRELFTKTPLWPVTFGLGTDGDVQPTTRH